MAEIEIPLKHLYYLITCNVLFYDLNVMILNVLSRDKLVK